MVSFQQLNQQSTSNHPTIQPSNHPPSALQRPPSNVLLSPSTMSAHPRCGAGVIVQQIIQLLPGLHAVEPGSLRAPPLQINQTTCGCLHRDPERGQGKNHHPI